MRLASPFAGLLARVVLISGALAPRPVFRGYTAAKGRVARGGGERRGMAFRGAFSRFEGV
jgi:hypothetical protein